VDSRSTACRTIKANLDSLDLRAEVIQGDAVQRLELVKVDLVLADPPYVFDDWSNLLAAAGKAFVVAESDVEIGPFEGWEVIRSRSYGKAVVTILRPENANMS